MSCTTVRIDDLDFNVTAQVNPAYPAYDPDRKKLYFVYCDKNSTADDPDQENWRVAFREYDELTDTLGTPVVIDEAVAPDDAFDRRDRASIVRLDDGTLICAYYFYDGGVGLIQTKVKESTDNGLTWSPGVLMDTDASSSRQFVDIGTDGTNVWGFTYQQGGGAGGQNLIFWKRTGVDTWSTPGIVVYDGHAGGPSAAELTWQYLGGKKVVIVVSSLIGLIVCERLDSGTTQRVTCFRTTDGGTTWSEVLIQSQGTDVANHYPITFMGQDGTIRSMWIGKNPTFPTRSIPTIAYSSDNGATWTVLGSPSVFSIDDGTVWKPQNKGFMLDSSDRMIVSTWKQVLGIWTIFIYRGDLSDVDSFEEIATCDIGSTTNSNLVGTSALMETDFIQVLDPIPSPPGNLYQIAYLREADINEEDVPPPPLVEESPTGSDANNIYIRHRQAEQRGWSIHDLSVSCWSLWPEGDYTTQRRLPILLAGASSIDATIEAPGNLPAIWKVDDPETYARRVQMTDPDGNTVNRYDPFRFMWHSKAYPMSQREGSEWAVMRGYVLIYRRTFEPFTVEVWVDGKIAQTDVFEPVGADLMDGDMAAISDPVFRPINTDDNLGTVCQFRIIDETEYPLIIEMIAPVVIQKGRRG